MRLRHLMGGFTFNTKGLWQKESYKGMGKDILIGSAGSMLIFGQGVSSQRLPFRS